MTGKAGVAAPEPDRHVGAEARKTYAAKLDDGFIEKYLSGMAILDIGYKRYENDIVPIVPQAVGVDVDYPGYDGRSLTGPWSAFSRWRAFGAPGGGLWAVVARDLFREPPAGVSGHGGVDGGAAPRAGRREISLFPGRR